MITLRKNQVEPISKATAFFKEKRPVPSLIVLPTAWGKSILTAFVANEIEDKLLVIQPSKELLEQNYKKYVSLCGIFEAQAGVFSASFGVKDLNRITYATIGSIKKLGKTFKRLGFKKMLIDEAHLYPREIDSMLGTFLEESEITHVLGITATPIKLQSCSVPDGRFSKLVMLTSKSKQGNFFKNIAHVSQVQEMIELGFWSKLEYKTSGFDSSQLVYNSSKSEFTEDSMQRAYRSNNIDSQIRQEIDLNSDRKHILVFVPSVNDAIKFSEQTRNSAAIYSGMHDSERERVIPEFRKGNIRVIFNVRVLSTGFDYTKIDCIILGISTASIALYYQTLGRGTRIDDEKENCLISDLAGNVDRFGKVEDITFEKERIWKMYGTGGRLLSGIPIHEIGTVKRGNTEKAAKEISSNYGKPLETMPFGKHKGESFKDIPKEYKEWMLKSFDWHAANMNLKQAIEASL